MSKRLRDILPNVENDPDLSRLCFGTNVISTGADDAEEGLISLAGCLKAGIDELEAAERADAMMLDPTVPDHREVPLKRYAIHTVFDLIEAEGKRAPNKLTAEIVSILIGADVTPNDVTQARKDMRRKNYRDE